MARDVESPYPANAVFAVHKGFKNGVFTEYRDLLAQTADYPGGKEVWAVFTDVQHAREFVSTGKCPVHPIAQHPTVGGVSIPDSSARSLPTPDASPETDAAPPALPARQLDRPSTSAPLKATVSLPPPAPRKATKVDHDSDGDTEPEDEAKAPSSSLPVAGSAKLHKTPSRQPGWITQALKRDQSNTSMSGTTPRPKTPPTTQPPALSPTKPVVAAAVPSSSAPSRPTHHSRPAAPGSGPFAPPPAPAPISAPAPTLIPELAQQQRPHGTYEMCGHCHGKGWLMTPAETTSHFSAPQPPVIQTPSRPRAKPTTNLKLVPNPSDSDSGSTSTSTKNRTPSGSRPRVSSIGGVGPERTPKRDQKRTVSDSVTARRRVSDGVKDKGKGKARAVEPMDLDATTPGAGPSAYNYM